MSDAMLSRKSIWMMVGCCLCLAGSLFGQTNFGEIRGKVSDPSGAAVPAAKVKVTFVAKNTVRDATTDSMGDYFVPTLEPGPYRVSVEAAGFKTMEQGPIVLSTGQTLEVDLVMALGNVNQKIEVTATPTLVNTSTAEVSGIIAPRAIEAMPLLGRDYLSLAVLLPGTNSGAPGDARQSGGGVYAGIDTVMGSAQAAVSTSGAEPDSNKFYLDGMDNTDYFQRNPVARPSIDAILEFQVQTSLPSVEYSGAAGGVISATTKSGTNAYHGVAYDFLRNNVFDARSFFDLEKPVRRRNQFGGDISGPLSIPGVYDAKNKTFFLFDYEGLRFRSAGTSIITVPTAAERSGNFSSFLPGTVVYDPTDVVSGQRVAFQNNMVTPSEINPISAKLVALYPSPNLPGLSNNYAGSIAESESYDNVLARVDENLSDKDRMFGRFSLSNDTIPGASLLPLSYENNALNSRTGAFYWNHDFSPSLLTEFRAALTRRLPQTYPISVSDTGAVTALGLTPYGIGGLTGFDTNYISGIGGGYEFQRVFSSLQLEEKVIKISGRNTIKTGFEVFAYRQDFLLTTPGLGSETFDGNLTRQIGSAPATSPAQSIAQFLLGLPSEQSAYGASVPGEDKTRTRDTDYSMYVNDDIRISDRLTLNLGLRYEMMLPPIFPNGRGVTYFDYQAGTLVYPANAKIPTGCCGWPYRLDTTRRIYNADWTDFAPRFGFAYRPFGNKTVIRGGYGIYYDDGVLGNLAFGAGLTAPWFSTSTDQVNLDNPNPAGFFNLNQNVTTNVAYAAPIGFATMQKNLRNGMVQEFNLSVERQLSNSTILTMAYVGSLGHRLLDGDIAENIPVPGPGSVQARRAYPDFGASLQYSAYGNSTYNSLQVQLEQRFWKNFSGIAGYTWSKAITPVINNNGVDSNPNAYHDNPYDWEADRSVADSDVPQRLVLSGVYALPALGSSGVSKAISHGWQLAAIYTAQSGFPYSAYVEADIANVGGRVENRAEYACCQSPNLPNGQRTTAQYFNTGAFTLPASYTYGNSGRNILRAQGFNNIDMALSRTFSLGEKQKLEVRLETFNTMNRPQLGIPNFYIDAPGFGTVTTTQNFGRELQWALKYSF